jgi:hypothetical protein
VLLPLRAVAAACCCRCVLLPLRAAACCCLLACWLPWCLLPLLPTVVATVSGHSESGLRRL